MLKTHNIFFKFNTFMATLIVSFLNKEMFAEISSPCHLLIASERRPAANRPEQQPAWLDNVWLINGSMRRSF